MVKNCKRFLLLVVSLIHACYGVPSGYTKSADGRRELNFLRKTGEKHSEIKRAWTPVSSTGTSQVASQNVNYGINLRKSLHSSYHKNSKKSDLPEKGQIKFMKTLLKKVDTLLNHGKERKAAPSKKKAAMEGLEKVTPLASNNGKLYGLLGESGDSKGKESEKSVNVISIPLNALAKISKNEPSNPDKDGLTEMPLKSMDTPQRNAQVILRPALPLRSGYEEDREEIPLSANKDVAPIVPVILQNPGQRNQGSAMMILNPGTRSFQPFGIFPSDQLGSRVTSSKRFLPKIPFVLQRHGDIVKHGTHDDNLYRDIGHIPGEFHDNAPGKTSLRHRRPGRYRQSYTRRHPEVEVNSRYDDRYDNDNDDDGEDDDDEDDDGDDDDSDDDEDDEDEVVDNNDKRMDAEEREIDATSKRLYSMLPGNDPTYTSENRGLNLMRTLPQMQVPEAFLGNPMLRGMGLNQANMLPFMGAAVAGEHADNSNDRDVFMMGNQGAKQVFGGTPLQTEDHGNQMPSMRVDNGGFTLGGSPAQAMSPNEVSYQLQKQALSNDVSQKDRITRPLGSHRSTGSANVLLEVNGHPIGDSKELRGRVVHGRILRGKEKIIKSKGPVNVKISRANDGVHSKVVDIRSPAKVNVLEAKSKIAKSH